MNHPKSEKNENSPECKIPKMKNEIWEDKQKRINEKQLTRKDKMNLRHIPNSESWPLEKQISALKEYGFMKNDTPEYGARWKPKYANLDKTDYSERGFM